MKQEIAKHSYIMLAGLVISSVFNYLYQVVMGLMLSKADFGILGVSLSAFFIASVLTQNTFTWSGTRRMSKNSEEILRVFRTTIAGNLLLVITASIAILFFSQKSETYFIPMLIATLALLISAITNSYNALFRAIRKFEYIACANVIWSVIKLILAIVLVILGLGVIGAVGSIAISMLIVLILFQYWFIGVKRYIPHSKGFAWDLVKETFYVSIVYLSIAFIVNSSIIFMRFFSGSDILAGDYNAALTIARCVFFITTALTVVIFSYTSSTDPNREIFAFQAVKYGVLFILPIGLSMAVNPKAWLTLFFGSKYIGGCEILRYLAIGLSLISLSFIVLSNLISFEDQKVPAIIMLISSLVLVIYLLSVKSDPVIASAQSVVISSLFALIVLTAYYRNRHYLKCSKSYLLKIAVAYALFLTVFKCLNVDSRPVIFIGIVAAYGIYFIILSILRLFDTKDVSAILSPFPKIANIVHDIVAKLNKI